MYSRILLTAAATCIVLGGLYDVFTPQLPPNLAAKCAGNEAGRLAIRELLRALGGCLVAIGAAVGVLATTIARPHQGYAVALILILVLPSEGLNAMGMWRAGSPYVAPLAFIALTVAGAALALLGT